MIRHRFMSLPARPMPPLSVPAMQTPEIVIPSADAAIARRITLQSPSSGTVLLPESLPGRLLLRHRGFPRILPYPTSPDYLRPRATDKPQLPKPPLYRRKRPHEVANCTNNMREGFTPRAFGIGCAGLRRSRQPRAGTLCRSGINSPISGPCAMPVTALRSGMNSPLPLRPVASFTSEVQSFHVVSE